MKKLDELKDVVPSAPLSEEEKIVGLKDALEAIKKINDILNKAAERRNNEG
jgi:hypothetical protein